MRNESKGLVFSGGDSIQLILQLVKGKGQGRFIHLKSNYKGKFMPMSFKEKSGSILTSHQNLTTSVIWFRF